MSTMSLKSGKTFNYDDVMLGALQESDFDIEDIANSLSNTCRFGGHTDVFYSVAQHSVLVAGLLAVERDVKLAGLLHDAGEAYIGDIVSPLKKNLFYRTACLVPGAYRVTPIKEIESNILKVLFDKFGAEYPYADLVSEVDLIMAKTEGERFLPSADLNEWFMDCDTLTPDELPIYPKDPSAAKKEFMECFESLGGNKP